MSHIHRLTLENSEELNIMAYRHLLATLSDTVDTDPILLKQQLTWILTCPCHFLFVTPSLEDPRGIVTLLKEQKLIHHGGAVGHLEDLVVHPENRGQGIGKDLVQHAINEAKRMGCYKVMLHCHTSLHPFYQSIGFYSKENTHGMRLDC